MKREDNYQCIEYYQKRYPELSLEEQQEMLKTHKERGIFKRPNNTGINNPAYHTKTTPLQRKQRSPMCIEFYQKRYPELSLEEQQEMLKTHKTKILERMKDKTIQVMCKEYWMIRGYAEEEAKQIIKENSKLKHTFTLNKCINKYGEEEGKKIFEERQIKWQKSLHNKLKNNTTNGKTQSLFANSIINILQDFFEGEKEYLLGKYSYDYRFQNKIIEFNGDYWHANPNIYDKNFVNKTTKLTASQIWDNDLKKKEYAESCGYKLLIIWEKDYKDDVSDTINKCMNFLND